jgi:uncharacterized protein (TIGR02246 family)
MPRHTALLIVLSLTLTACATRPTGGLSAADTAAIEGVSSAWLAAAARKDADAVARLYAEDAAVMSPNRPIISNRPGVRDWFAGLPNFASMSTSVAEIEGRNDLAMARLAFVMTLQIPGRPLIEERGKILQVLRRQPDGSWLIWRESFSSDSPRR